MKCPNCGLINHESTLRCDCGYDFKESKVKKSYSKSFQKKDQGWKNFFLSFYTNARRDTLGIISFYIFLSSLFALVIGLLSIELCWPVIIFAILGTVILSPIGFFFGMMGVLGVKKEVIDNRLSILGVILNILIFGLAVSFIILENRARY